MHGRAPKLLSGLMREPAGQTHSPVASSVVPSRQVQLSKLVEPSGENVFVGQAEQNGAFVTFEKVLDWQTTHGMAGSPLER